MISQTLVLPRDLLLLSTLGLSFIGFLSVTTSNTVGWSLIKLNRRFLSSKTKVRTTWYYPQQNKFCINSINCTKFEQNIWDSAYNTLLGCRLRQTPRKGQLYNNSYTLSWPYAGLSIIQLQLQAQSTSSGNICIQPQAMTQLFFSHSLLGHFTMPPETLMHY